MERSDILHIRNIALVENKLIEKLSNYLKRKNTAHYSVDWKTYTNYTMSLFSSENLME